MDSSRYRTPDALSISTLHDRKYDIIVKKNEENEQIYSLTTPKKKQLKKLF